jgi:hypothetical protein
VSQTVTRIIQASTNGRVSLGRFGVRDGDVFLVSTTVSGAITLAPAAVVDREHVQKETLQKVDEEHLPANTKGNMK